MKRLIGKIAVVTGASSGIGAACARALAEEGANVVIGYNHGFDRAKALCELLPQAESGQSHSVMQITLKSTTAHSDIAQMLQSKFGKIDILVNSAGFTRRVAHADLETMDDQLFNDILISNVGGTFSITRAFMPLLQASANALVVNVSSISAFTGSGSNIAYCAAKAALDTMAMSMARVFGPAVRFLCVSPGSVDTGFVEGRTREELAKKATQTPLGRVVTPEDVALAVVACATHLKTATGTRIVIDGGQQL